MNYNFDLNSQESISFANVVMENNDNNLAARALLQSWAANIPTNLSLLNKNTKKTSTSSPLNKKDRIIPSKRRSSTVNKQIEKLENQLEKEKKLQKYKQEILEQKLKSDLEIYRKEYKVLRELEKTMIKPNGNNSKISRNEIGLSKRNNHINDKNDLEIIEIENIENKENLLNEKNKMTMDNKKCRKNDKLNIENRKNQITSMINSNNNNLSTKNKNTQETTLYENKEEKKDENVSVTNSMKTNNNSSLSNHIANTLQSLKNCSTDEVIHIIDDLIQNNTMNNNYNNNNKNINNNNKNINNNNNSINNNDDTININKNNNENSKIIINNNKNSRDSNNIISSSNSNINEKKDKNYHENIDPENSIIYKEKIIHEKVVNIIKNKENSNDNGKNNIDHNEIIIENKEIIDRSSIESIYHMKVHLKAWYLLIVNDKFKCNNFQEKNKWKLKNYIFSTWMKAYKRSKNRREIIQEAENYKNEQIKWIKATKYWMQTTKSKYFAAWTIYSEIIKQENQIKEQHKTRVKKMNEFLNRAKQRLTQKECKEEVELKMNPFNPIIDQDKNLSKKLSQRNNENGFFTLNEKESFSKNEKNKEVKKELSSSSSSKASTSIEAESTSTTITTNTLSSTNTISNTKNNKKIVTSTTTSTSTITSSSVRKLKLTKPKITKADKKFCEEMEKRNQAILERKRQSEQRRKEKEEKLKKQKEEEEQRKEEERKLEIQRERQKKIEEKKKAKLEQIEKEKRHEKFLKDVARAKEHYQRTLISNYGLYPWIQYRKMIQSDTQEAEQHYQIKIKKQFFLHWYSKILDRQSEKEHQALTYYRKKCLKKYFTIHFQAYQEQLMILENCDELYLFNLMKSVWSQWLKRLEEKQEEEREKQEKLEKIADNFAKDYIPKRFLRKWISYYRNKKDEQWREYRKDLLRGKVKEWLSHSILNTKNICQQ